MVVGIIARVFQRIGSQGFRQLYRAVNYQDKAIDTAWSRARISKPIRQGVRHGAAGGAISGTFLKELIASDTPGNDNVVFQKKKQRPQFTSRKSYKARVRPAVRCYRRNNNEFKRNRNRR